MNKKGQFGFIIVLILAVMLIYLWLVITPVAVEPFITSTIASTSGATHADGIEFFLRMILWAVPLILIVGFIAWGFSQ